MHKFFNLQLLDDGGQGGAGNGQGGNAGSGNGGQAGNAGNNGGNNGASYSFQQAEEIANARAQRAERSALASYFQQQGLSEDQVTQAINDFKAHQAAQKPNVDAITKERDEARAELAAMKNSQKLTQLGVRPEFSRFVLSEIDALMKEDSKLDFDKAAAKFLKENPQYKTGNSSYRVKTGTDGSGAGSADNKGNAFINDAIRRAARKSF
jgi:hypothetical protein